MAKLKRRQPYDPSKLVHDRRATDLVRGAQVAPIEVDDPLEAGGKLYVMRSSRNDPLAALHARRHIDEAQYHGGRAFQHDFETAERGPRAIDPSKEAVDGGRMPEPITESQRKAAMRLALVHKELGANGSSLMHAFLIGGLNAENICDNRNLAAERERLYVGRRIRECLEDLAVFYGFASQAVDKYAARYKKIDCHVK